jgi:hypothetical protein
MSIQVLTEAEIIYCLQDENYLEAVNERRKEGGLEEIPLVELIKDNIDIVKELDLVDIFKENNLLWSRVKEFFISEETGETEEEIEE